MPNYSLFFCVTFSLLSAAMYLLLICADEFKYLLRSKTTLIT